jgi:hypothetical protein
VWGGVFSLTFVSALFECHFLKLLQFFCHILQLFEAAPILKLQLFEAASFSS